MTQWGVKVKYTNGRSKVVESPDGKTHEKALEYKIKLMTKTQNEDTEYYVVPLERNP